MPMKQILSIQSAVTYGFVGNSVAAPVITTLGMQPLLIDTIFLAAHPGYGTIAGGPADQTQFSAILEALTTLRVLPQIDNVMTGYLGDAGQAGPIYSMIQNWQKERCDGLYILDRCLAMEVGFMLTVLLLIKSGRHFYQWRILSHPINLNLDY